jgi:hypothetical protein
MSAPKQVKERTFTEILEDLRQPVDPKLIKQREGWHDRNGTAHTVDFVEWHVVADILDEKAPGWSHEVKSMTVIGDILAITVALTISGVTREGVGTGLAASEMGIKRSEHDALKRAAVKFGVARDLYKKETEEIEKAGSVNGKKTSDGFPEEAIARNLGELVTAKQLGMIRALARELRLDADSECDRVMHCRTDELSKIAASSLIGHLQQLLADEKNRVGQHLPGGADLHGKEPKEPSDEEQSEQYRKDIDANLRKVGIAPEEWLARFDTHCKTMIEKQKAYASVNVHVRERQQQQIEKCLNNQGWDVNQRLGEFKRFGIQGNLANASPQQIDAMWSDYVAARMIIIK